MTVWIEECFELAADPKHFMTYARCYKYRNLSHIFSYITLSTIQLIILVACIILLTRDVKRRGGLCVNFIHSHQTITLLLCSIFSLGNFSELTYFRCHFTLPSNGFNFASDLFHIA